MNTYTLGIDIGSTTVKIAILDEQENLLFADYERHFANIQETLADLLEKAQGKLGEMTLCPVITGSGGLTLANHLEIPFVQEVIAVSTSLQKLAPKTDVAIELGGEDAKIIYFEGGNIEQRMNGICAGGTGSFIDQMASLLQTDATWTERICEELQGSLSDCCKMWCVCKDRYSAVDQRWCNKGGSFCVYFPGSSQSDDFRTGMW